MSGALSNEHLLHELKKLVGQEKAIIVRVIELLKVVEARKLYLEKSYSSIFSFATEFLGYSEFEAHTRLQAARLTQVIPEVTDKILTGELNLSVAACAQSQFRKEDQRRKENGQKPMNRSEKSDALKIVSNCSRRQAEEKLNEHFGQQSDLKEYSFLAARELQSQIDKVMDEYSHINFERDLGKLVETLVKEKIAQIEKKKDIPPARKDKTMRAQKVTTKPVRKSRMHISIHTKRDVQKRTGNMCSYVDVASGKVAAAPTPSNLTTSSLYPKAARTTHQI